MNEPPVKTKGYAFGTFKGVFTPSILTILGVIMYLRLGWVLGNVGLALTLVIVTVSSSVTFHRPWYGARHQHARQGRWRVLYDFALARCRGRRRDRHPVFGAGDQHLLYTAAFAEAVVALLPMLDVGAGLVTLAILGLITVFRRRAARSLSSWP